MNPSIERALKAKRESRYIEFKERFDVEARSEWCELLKDLAAIANSGGGVVLIGVDNKGEPAGQDVSAVLNTDPVVLADKIHRYTDANFSDFEISEARKGRARIAAIKIGPAFPPIVFTKPGTYPIDGGKQKTAFSQGTVYFRHGAKSEPGNSDDLRRVLERELELVRQGWLTDVRKVVKAPAGSHIAVLPPTIRHADEPDARRIQIVDDPNAPAYRVVDVDASHPYRAKELVAEVTQRLPADASFNSFDLLAVRKAHGIEQREEFSHKPKFGSRQYSRSFVDWMVRQFNNDGDFFLKARKRYRER